MSSQFLFTETTVSQQLQRATVIGLCDDGLVEISWSGGTALCDVLCTASGPVPAEVGDTVLAMIPPSDAERGVVIGRVGLASAPNSTPANSGVLNGETPDELILEAKESLTLRVGEGSITIRADGKILIKGKDLVSHAQRVNRIRGGSVAIN